MSSGEHLLHALQTGRQNTDLRLNFSICVNLRIFPKTRCCSLDSPPCCHKGQKWPATVLNSCENPLNDLPRNLKFEFCFFFFLKWVNHEWKWNTDFVYFHRKDVHHQCTTIRQGWTASYKIIYTNTHTHKVKPIAAMFTSGNLSQLQPWLQVSLYENISIYCCPSIKHTVNQFLHFSATFFGYTSAILCSKKKQQNNKKKVNTCPTYNDDSNHQPFPE